MSTLGIVGTGEWTARDAGWEHETGPGRYGPPKGGGQARKSPDGDQNKHTGGHSAVAEGDGCAGLYLEATLRALGETRGAAGVGVRPEGGLGGGTGEWRGGERMKGGRSGWG